MTKSWLPLILAGFLACRPTEPPEPADSTPPDETATPTVPPPPAPDVLAFEGDRPTNLLILSLDTVRWDRVGRYADGDSLTPFLDGILEQSVVLDRHHSCSNWTAPSMLCATSGLSPIDVGAFEPRQVAAQLPTVARVLDREGYQTRLVTANTYYFSQRDALGFEVIEAIPYPETADRVVDGVLQQYDSTLDPASPWYLHGHLFDPHKPLCPPEAYREGESALPPLGPDLDLCLEYRQTLNALWRDGNADQRATFRAHLEFLYGGEMRFLDDQLRRLWEGLEARGALDDTLVVIFSDHGEQFMERRPIVDHPWDLFAEENRAVAAFWAKNLAPLTVTTRTVHEDLAATLYTLFEALPERPIRGLPLGTAPADRAIWLVHEHNDENIVAVVQGHHQLTLNFGGPRFFHDLEADPKQLDNLYDPENEDVLQLWTELEPALDAVASTFPSWPVPDRTP